MAAAGLHSDPGEVRERTSFQTAEPWTSPGNLGSDVAIVYGVDPTLPERARTWRDHGYRIHAMTPVQLENMTVPNCLDGFRVLLSYRGQKPLSPEVHAPLADWVKSGGVLVVVDDDSDPFNPVREWWNSDGRNFAAPREHLFEELGLPRSAAPFQQAGKGAVYWMRKNPTDLAADTDGDTPLVELVKAAAASAGLEWRETNYLLLRRGPYVVAAGLDESVGGGTKTVGGRFVNLLDPELRVQENVQLVPASRLFLLDLDAAEKNTTQVLAAACKAVPTMATPLELTLVVEGVGNTPAVVLIRAPDNPQEVTLEGKPLASFEYSEKDRLLWIRFMNEARPRELTVKFPAPQAAREKREDRNL